MRNLFIVLGSLITLSFTILLSTLFGMMFSDPQPLLPVLEKAFGSLITLCILFVVTLSTIAHGKRR